MRPGSVVHVDEVPPRPWANGGGTTRELLVAGDGAWRVSLADIDEDRPFSEFPGRHRLLTVVDGAVLALLVDGSEQVVEPRRPFAFPGGARVTASLPEGPVRALNVIVDPARVHPSVTVLELGRASRLPLGEDQTALVLQGSARAGDVDAPAGSFVAGPVELAGRSTVAVVSLSRAD